MNGKSLLKRASTLLLAVIMAVPISLTLMPSETAFASSADNITDSTLKELLKACNGCYLGYSDVVYFVNGNAKDKSAKFYIEGSKIKKQNLKNSTISNVATDTYGKSIPDVSKDGGVIRVTHAIYTDGKDTAVLKGGSISNVCRYYKFPNAVHGKDSKLYDLVVVLGNGDKEKGDPASTNYHTLCYSRRDSEKRGFMYGGHSTGTNDSPVVHSWFRLYVTQHTDNETIGTPVDWTGAVSWEDSDKNEGFIISKPVHAFSSDKSPDAYWYGSKLRMYTGKTTAYGDDYRFIGKAASDSNTYSASNINSWLKNCVVFYLKIPSTGVTMAYQSWTGLGGCLISEMLTDTVPPPPPPTTKTIKFNINGGSGSVPGDITFNSDSETHDTNGTRPTRTGYIFKGWSATQTYSSSNKRVDYNGKEGATQTSNWTYSTWCSNTGGNSSSNTLTLYAQWEPEGTTPPPTQDPVYTSEDRTSSSESDYYYYVYYYPNGGSGTVASQSVKYKHIDYITTTTIQYKDGVEVGRTSSTREVPTYYTPTVTLRSNTFSPPYGYSKASGWSTSSGLRPSRGYWYNSESPSPVNSQSYSEGQSVTLNGNLTLYARWKPNQHRVTYHKNHTAGTVHGTPNPATVYFDQEINVGTSKYYATRTGWSFMGWHTNQTSKSVFSPVVTLNSDNDWTLYAIYKRSLNLILASDALESKPEYTFPMTIYTHDPAFVYNSTSFRNATTRTKGTYTLTFKNNNGSRNIGYGEMKDSEGRVISTDLNGSTIVATRWFNGWYPDERSGYQADTSSTKVGTSGTSVTVTPKEYTAHDYNVAGNTGNYNRTYSTDTVKLYPIYNKTYVKLPDSRRNEDKGNNALHGGDEKDGSEEDLFIGWFTKPQPDDGGTGDGGIYYGKAGDVVEIKSNVILYPWFNIAPVIVRSAIGEDLNGITPDGVKKGFYEGQPVSYQQMMSLINAYDEDNPAEVGPEGLVTYNGPKVWTTLLRLNLISFLHDTYPDMTAAELDKYEQMANYDCFVPKLMGIEYKRDGKDPNGFNVSDGIPQTQTINGNESAMLLTDQENVGHVVLHYQVTDNGTFANGVQILTGRVSPGGKVYTIDSPITVEFYLDTVINFNNLPRITTKSVPLYSVDDNINSGNITKILLDYQDATDHEDDHDYKPWWYKAETGNNLDNSLNIVRIYDIRFNTGYQNEHPDECAEVAKIDNIIDLFKLKDEGRVVFQHITNFMVEIDCVDQWGKHASGYYGNDHGIDGSYDMTSKKPDGSVKPIGMNPTERSFCVIMFNDYDDYDLVLANTVVAERMRYIDPYWAEYLNGNSYWGTFAYGKNKLKEIFENYKNRGPSETYSGHMTDGTSITINDYTTY